MSTVCLGTSMSSCLTKLEQELCEWRGRKKGRQNILRILMYVGGEVVLNSHTLLRKASVLQRQNAVLLSKRLLSLNNRVNRILSLSRSPRIPFPRKRWTDSSSPGWRIFHQFECVTSQVKRLAVPTNHNVQNLDRETQIKITITVVLCYFNMTFLGFGFSKKYSVSTVMDRQGPEGGKCGVKWRSEKALKWAWESCFDLGGIWKMFCNEKCSIILKSYCTSYTLFTSHNYCFLI